MLRLRPKHNVVHVDRPLNPTRLVRPLEVPRQIISVLLDLHLLRIKRPVVILRLDLPRRQPHKRDDPLAGDRTRKCVKQAIRQRHHASSGAPAQRTHRLRGQHNPNLTSAPPRLIKKVEALGDAIPLICQAAARDRAPYVFDKRIRSTGNRFDSLSL